MKRWILSLLVLAPFLSSTSAHGGAREQAERLYSSLTGSKATREQLDHMESILAKEDPTDSREMVRDLAKDIVDSKGLMNNHGAFYSVVVKNLVTPWSSKEGLVVGDLNDMTATVIGYIRDERIFNSILHENIIYKASGIKVTFENGFSDQSGNVTATPCGGEYPACDCKENTPNCWCNPLREQDKTSLFVRFSVPTPTEEDPFNKEKFCRETRVTDQQFKDARRNVGQYVAVDDALLGEQNIDKSNAHYESIEELGLDLSNPRVLIPYSQVAASLVDNENATAGILTSRAYGKAFLTAGTNRAAVAYGMQNFFCKSMEQLNDTTTPDFRNRQDVDRNPGGVSDLYKSWCVGCHAGMDAQAGAWAYYNYNDGIVYAPEQGVQSKMIQNSSVFSKGFVTEDDSWVNLWNEGKNAEMGWPEISSGTGVKSLGKMYAQTEAFNSCMATQVFSKVCYRAPGSEQEKEVISQLTDFYKQNNHNMKALFIETALVCMGE